MWRHIDRAFAEPVMRADDTADYAPTQILAELFREKRDGRLWLGYRSALDTGHYLALFDIVCADVINVQVFRVDKLDVVYSEADKPYFVSCFYGKAAKQPQRGTSGGRG